MASNIFAELEGEVKAGNWSKVVSGCEKWERERVWQGDLPVEFYQFFLLGCVASDALPTARFLQKRVPAKVKSDSGFTQTYYVVQHLWNNRIAAAQRQLRSLPVSQGMHATVAAATEALRARTLALYSKAYTTISLGDFAAALGTSEQDTVSRATNAGVLREVKDGHAHLKPIALVASGDALTDLNTLQKLANHVLFVEK